MPTAVPTFLPTAPPDNDIGVLQKYRHDKIIKMELSMAINADLNKFEKEGAADILARGIKSKLGADRHFHFFF